MNFSILETIRDLLAPQHKVSCSWLLWHRLVSALRERGRGESRESGAFFLGYERHGRLRIVDFILYDDLDPHCLETGIVRFNGKYFGDLWAVCKRRKLSVVADIHVHPGSSQQSESDRQHPMISCPGHVAFIIPRFAHRPVLVAQLGIYLYQGQKQWVSIPADQRLSFMHIGL